MGYPVYAYGAGFCVFSGMGSIGWPMNGTRWEIWSQEPNMARPMSTGKTATSFEVVTSLARGIKNANPRTRVWIVQVSPVTEVLENVQGAL